MGLYSLFDAVLGEVLAAILGKEVDPGSLVVNYVVGGTCDWDFVIRHAILTRHVPCRRPVFVNNVFQLLRLVGWNKPPQSVVGSLNSFG